MSDTPAPNSDNVHQVALLIDGDNIEPVFAGAIIASAVKFGQLAIKRVYGNSRNIQKWDDAPGFRTIHSGSVKNGADILLSIEAVDLAHNSSVGTFVIASSDRDFSHIAHHLRESGFKVVGLGQTKAPPAFRKACNIFHEVSLKPETAPKQPPEQKLTPLDMQITGLIGGAKKKQIGISQLSNLMNTRFNVQTKALPQKNWRKYLESKRHLYLCDPKSRTAKVRLAPEPQNIAGKG